MMDEKKIGTRTFYTTPQSIYIDAHPHDIYRQIGATFKVIAAPVDGNHDEQFKRWRLDTWRVLKGGVTPLKSEPLTEKQLAWVFEHFPQFKPSE